MIYDDAVSLYEQQYLHYRDDLQFYINLALDYNGPVLELGAGTGRISVPVAQRGIDVIALEASAAMLAKAQARLAQEGLEERLTLHQADIRSFSLDEVFPLIIAPFNVLMHLYSLKDQDACMACIGEHLAPDGLFAFDLYNPHFTDLAVVKPYPDWQRHRNNSELFFYQEHDATQQRLTTYYYLDQEVEEGVIQRRRTQLTQRYYGYFEVIRWLQAAGFSNIQCYGHFDKRPYRREEPHLVVMARR